MKYPYGARRFLVVTPNIVVGEDLREAMSSYAGADVDVVASLDLAAGEPYDVAVFGLRIDEVLHDCRVRALRNAGTRIVVLGGSLPSSALDGTGVTLLPQPFLTEDVENLLDRLSEDPEGNP